MSGLFIYISESWDTMEMMDAVRIRIQHYMKERNLTLTALAMLCGLTQSTLENITEKSTKTAGSERKNLHITVEVCVRVTYFHGQSPGNYRRRTCA